MGTNRVNTTVVKRCGRSVKTVNPTFQIVLDEKSKLLFYLNMFIMTKELNISIDFPEELYLEYYDDWRLYSAGLFDGYLFMMGPTAIALCYFKWKGWKVTSCPYENEIRLYNYSVNKMIGIKSYLTDITDCWRVEDIWWQDCVTISAKTLNLN